MGPFEADDARQQLVWVRDGIKRSSRMLAPTVDEAAVEAAPDAVAFIGARSRRPADLARRKLRGWDWLAGLGYSGQNHQRSKLASARINRRRKKASARRDSCNGRPRSSSANRLESSSASRLGSAEPANRRHPKRAKLWHSIVTFHNLP